ncbi:MAG TPA: EAL domain-containing protein [Mycobacteriales bacterium]|nr:EAL domain-containing protein [Mycobacteriales bacterium]
MGRGPLPGTPAQRRATAALALLALWLLLPTGGERLDSLVSGGAWIASAAVATAACLWAGSRGGRTGRAWRLLAVASASWGAGCVWWVVLHLRTGLAPPFPSPADVGFLLFPLVAVLGLLRLPGLPPSRTSRLRLLLDGAVVTASLVLLAQLAGMAHVGRPGAAALTGRLVFIALEMLAGTVALLVLDRVRRGGGTGVRRAAAGVLVVVLSDVLYSAVASGSGYVAGGPVDVLWCAGFLLVADGALARATPDEDPRPGTRLLPALPAAGAIAALVLSGRLGAGLDLLQTALVVALGAALTARQVLLGLENAALQRALAQEVAERTEQLDAAVRDVHRQARTDPLTGLANRDGFVEAAVEALAHTGDDGRTAVVLLDLDRFQEVNDGLGHDVGDTVLEAAARRLACGLRPGQVLARLGGDEFAVLLTDLPRSADAVAVAERLARLMGAPLDLGPFEVVVGASAGLAVHTGAPADRWAREIAVRDLLRDADTALHAAKADGGGTSKAFRPEMHTAVRRSLQLQVDLRAALQAGALHVHYQPVVDLVADRVVGVEALARWTHPVHGPVPPLEFVAAAERSGLVVALERIVLDTACGQLAAWRRASPGLTVAVNVSARHLREHDLLETVISTLGRHGLPPSALVLEVTESLLFHDDDHVRRVLGQLHTAGVGLALDDFGTGYSSLSRLVDYPFDTLKVDRSFVNGIDRGTGTAVLTATLAMARGLGMRVVAEGVETPDQLSFLTDSGCELAQGYLLSRPGPAADVGPVLGRRLLPGPRVSGG